MPVEAKSQDATTAKEGTDQDGVYEEQEEAKDPNPPNRTQPARFRICLQRFGNGTVGLFLRAADRSG